MNPEELKDPFANSIDDNSLDSFVVDDHNVASDRSIEQVANDSTVIDDDSTSLGDYAVDAATGVGRGIVGFGQSIYDLADYAFGDGLPDVDLRDMAGIGESQTWVGSLSEGITQFALGFIPAGAAIRGVSALGKASKMSKILTTAKAGNKLALNGKGMFIAGATSDFISFDGQEERLSNLLVQYPALKNPVTEYLAADEEDGEIEGRFKNVLEGMFAELGIGIPLALAFQKSVKAIKRGRTEVPADQFDSHLQKTQAEIQADADEAKALIAEMDKPSLNEERVGGDQTRDQLYAIITGRDISTQKDLDADEDWSNIFDSDKRRDVGDSTGTRGVDNIIRSIAKEADNPNTKMTQRDVQRAKDFFNTFGGDAFKDVKFDYLENDSLWSTKAGSFNAIESLVKLYRGVEAGDSVGHTFFHEAAHAMSRSLGDKEVKLLKGYYSKELSKLVDEKPYLKEFTKKGDDGLEWDFNKQQTPEENQAWLEKYGLDNPKGSKEENKFLDSGRLNISGGDYYKYTDADEMWAESVAQIISKRGDFKGVGIGFIDDMLKKFRDMYLGITDVMKAKKGGNPTAKILDQFRKRELGEINTPNFIEGNLEAYNKAKQSDVPASPKGEGGVPSAGKDNNIDPLGSGGKARATELSHVDTTDDLKDLFTTFEEKVSDAAPRVDTQSEKDHLKAAINQHKDDPEFLELLNQGGAAKLAEQDASEIARYSQRRTTVRHFKKGSAANIIGMLEKITGIGKAEIGTPDVTKADLDKFKRMLDQHNGLVGYESRINSELGRGLRMSQIDDGKIIAKDPSKMTKDQKVRETAEGGGLSEDDLVNLAAMIKDNEEKILIDPSFLDQLVSIQKHKRSKWDAAFEYWVNAILSGPKTIATNLNSGLFTSALQLSFVTGGGEQMTKALINFGLKNINLQRSWSMLKEGVRDGYSPFEGLGGRSSMTDAVRARQMVVSRDNAIGTIAKDLMTLPSRILASTDAVMKEFNYRVAAQTKIAYEAMAEGITDGNQIAKIVEDRMEKIILQGGGMNNVHNSRKNAVRKLKEDGKWESMTYTEKADFVQKAEDVSMSNLKDETALQQFAKGQADINTYTNELEGNMGEIAKGLRNVKGARWIVPFITTPVNVIARSIDIGTYAPRVALGKTLPKFDKLEGLRSKLLADLNHEDPFIKAQAQGKLAFSAATLVSVGAAVNGTNMITGGGPSDPAERKRMEDAGWQKYSVKIGNKYISYQKLDPIASIVGVMADMRDTFRDPSTMDNGFAEVATTALMTSMTQNILDKSFLTGIDTFVSALSDERKMERYLRNSVASFVPSVISQSKEIVTGSPVTAEIWSLSDALHKRLAFATGSLDKKRNILGEPVSAQELDNVMMQGFDIVANVSESKDDIVLEEIASLRNGFDIPSKLVGNGINLLDYDHQETGRTAYDFYREAHGNVKIKGRTLRQEMTKVIKSRWYQKLDARSMPNFRSQRIGELQKIIGRYRREALKSTLDEFPEINSIYQATNVLRKSQRSGTSIYDEVEELINSTQ